MAIRQFVLECTSSRHAQAAPPAPHRVGGPPVQQVEVVVIDEVGGIQDAVGLLGHRAEHLLGAGPRVGAVEGGHVVLVALGGRGRLLLEGQDAGGPVLPEVGSQLLLVLQLRQAGSALGGQGCGGWVMQWLVGR